MKYYNPRGDISGGILITDSAQGMKSFNNLNFIFTKIKFKHIMSYFITRIIYGKQYSPHPEMSMFR